MTPGPVFLFELLTIARRRRYYVLRFGYGAILLWIVWGCYSSAGRSSGSGTTTLTIQQASSLGWTIFLAIAAAQFAAVLMLTPALVAGVIADERMRKTLHYLMASCLGSGEIVLGKLASRLITIAVYLMVALPILAILGFLGGVDPNEVFLLFLASGSTAYVIASYSMFVSVHARRPRAAVISVYMTELVWLFLPSILKHATPWGRLAKVPLIDVVRVGGDWVGWTSPLYVLMEGAMRFGSPSSWYAMVWEMIGLQLLCGSLLAALAVARLRPAFRAESSGPEAGLWAKVRSKRRPFPRPACYDDPILWKELFVGGGGAVGQAVVFTLWVGVVCLVGYWTFEFAKDAAQEAWSEGYFQSVDRMGHRKMNVFSRAVATVLLVCWEFGVAVVAAGTLCGEREADTWTSLIATPLTPWQIVRGKFLGAVASTWTIAFLWLLVTGTGLLVGAIHPLGFLAGTVVAAAFVGFAATLGMFYSLRARSSSRALTATIATLLVTNGLYLLACVGTPFGTTFSLIGVTPFVAAASLASYSDIGTFTSASISGSHDYGTAIDLLVTGIASVLTYGAATAALAYYIVVEFDDVIDRPRTSGGRRKGRRDPRPDKSISAVSDDFDR